MKLFVFCAIIVLAAAQPRQLNGGSAPQAVAASVQRTKDCPAGFELIGKQCMKTDIIEPNLVCPPGTTLVNGECASFARASRVCADGYSLGGKDQCSTVNILPASLVCDNGDLTDTQCRITKAVAPRCPPGLQQRDGQCVRFTPVEKICPPSYQLHGKECSKRLSTDASPVCPAEFSLTSGDRCTKSIPVPPYCPQGYSSVGYECVKQAPKVPAPCPASFSPSGNQCRRSDETPTRPECPADFTLDASGQCIKELPVPPTCPAGTARGSNGQCEKVVPRVPVCEEGEELVGGQCKRQTFYASDLVCPDSYTLIHGKCKKAATRPTSVRCAVGVLKGDQCVVESSTVPLLACPDGYALAKGGKCVREASYDCSKSVTQSECDMPEFVGQLTGGLRALNGDYKAKPVAIHSKGQVAKDAESKRARCAPVTRVVQQTCSKIEEAPANYVCPNGAAPRGKSCPVVSTAEAVPYCSSGQFDKATGQCVTFDIKPSKTICSVGQLQPDGNCLEVNAKPASQVCPEPSSESGGRCVIPQDEIVHPNRVVRQAPQYVCDSGSKRGKSCVQEVAVPRETICPAGTEDRQGVCTITAELITPAAKVVTQNSKYVCDDGSELVGKSCYRTEVIPSEYTCRSASQEGSRCVHSADLIYPPAQVSHIAARPVCPSGFQQQRNQCRTVLVQPADLQCPSSFTRFESGARECVKPHARVPVCPAGTQQTKNGCIKKAYAPPTVTEVKVCTKGTPGC